MQCSTLTKSVHIVGRKAWGQMLMSLAKMTFPVLLTPEQVQQLSVPAYKNHKDKKRDKMDRDKFIDPSTITFFGPSDTDKTGTVGVSPAKAVASTPAQSLKFVNDLYFASVETVHSAVKNLPVAGHLKNFWEIWGSVGVSPRVVSIMKEGYNLPFKVKPSEITRNKIVKS